MKKLWRWLLLFMLAVPILGIGHTQAQAVYDYEVVSKSDNPILTQGQQIVLWAKLKNTSSVDWYKLEDIGSGTLPIHLGTIRPADRNSGFYTPFNWISTNRTHLMDQDIVYRGGEGTFGFYATVPGDMLPGTYTECFAPVLENTSWFPDKGLCWDIKVFGEPSAYDYRADIDATIGKGHLKLALEPGQTADVSFEVLNTGNTIWEQNGQYPIHLGTWGDYQANSYHQSWLSENRPAGLREKYVYPGEYGHFDFTVQAPMLDSKYDIGESWYDAFWLVAEGKQWFPGSFDDFGYLEDLQVDMLLVEDSDLNQVLIDSLESISEVKSLAYTGKISSPDSPVVMDMEFFGEIDQHDENNPIENMTMTMDMEQMRIEIEAREKGDKSYIKFAIEDIEDLGMEYLEDFNDQWIKIDEESLRELYESWGIDYDELVGEEDQSELIIDEEQIMDLIEMVENARLMTLVKKIDEQKVDGVTCDHYTFVYDLESARELDDQFQTFLENNYSSFLDGSTMTSLPDMWEGEIWIGQKDNLPRRILSEDIAMDDYGQEMIMDLYLHDYDETFTFDEPDQYLTLTEVMEMIDKMIEDLMEDYQSMADITKAMLN